MINSLILLFFLTLQQRNKVGTLMNLIIFTFIEKLKKSIWRIFFFRYALSASKSLICHNQPSFKLGQFVWSQTFPTVCIFSIIRFKSHDFSIFKKNIYISNYLSQSKLTRGTNFGRYSSCNIRMPMRLH